jgi:hypothetical protein
VEIDDDSPDNQGDDVLHGLLPNEKQCPFCAETIKSEAVKFRFCGEMLTEGQEVRVAANPRKSRGMPFQALGWVLLGLGVLITFVGLGMDTSVQSDFGGRVHNIGLMDERRNAIMLGLAISGGGLLLLIASAFLARLPLPGDERAMTVKGRSKEKLSAAWVIVVLLGAMIIAFVLLSSKAPP